MDPSWVISSLTRIYIFPRHFALGFGTPLAILGVAITGDLNIGAVREVKSQMVWENTDLESSRFFVVGFSVDGCWIFADVCLDNEL